MGAIAGMLDATEEEPTPLQKEVARIGRVLGVAVVVIALIAIAMLYAWFMSLVNCPSSATNSNIC